MKDSLRSAAHLQREIGDAKFEALVSSDNTKATGGFAGCLIEPSLLVTEMTVGGRTYELLTPFADHESLQVAEVLTWAQEMGLSTGEEEARHILKQQQDIPEVLNTEGYHARDLSGAVNYLQRPHAVLVFPGWISKANVLVAGGMDEHGGRETAYAEKDCIGLLSCYREEFNKPSWRWEKVPVDESIYLGIHPKARFLRRKLCKHCGQ